jgi:hypothetical protein
VTSHDQLGFSGCSNKCGLHLISKKKKKKRKILDKVGVATKSKEELDSAAWEFTTQSPAAGHRTASGVLPL